MTTPLRTAMLAALVLAMGAPASAQGATTTTYAFGKASEVRYHMVHQLHEFSGTTHALRGKVALRDGKLVTPLKLQVPLVTFDSGNTNRDTNALLVLDAGKFPSVALAVTAFTERTRSGSATAFEVAGDAEAMLTLRGVTKPLKFPLKAKVGPEGLTADAAFEVSLTAFGIERPALLFKPVEDVVRVTVHGVAAPVP